MRYSEILYCSRKNPPTSSIKIDLYINYGKEVSFVLQIIYGHSGSGKTGAICDMMVKDAAEGRRSYLIVPEQDTVSSERRLLELLPPSAQLTSEVLNFSRLANLVFRNLGGLSYNYADKGSKILIMWQNLRQLLPLLTEYSRALEGGGMKAAEELLSAVSELKAYCVTPHKLDKAAEEIKDNPILKNKLRDLSLLMAAYTAQLEECYSDAADDLSRLCEKLDGNDFFSGSHIYIDSFSSFTLQEREVINRLMKQADRVTVTLPLDKLSSECIHYAGAAETALQLKKSAERAAIPFEELHLGDCKKASPSIKVISESLWSHHVTASTADDQEESVRIIKASDPYEEAEAAATVALGLVMDGLRCRDIAIIARDASLYRGIIDSALEKASLPYFFSQKTDVLSKAPIKFIISALKIKIYNWRREDVITYLKTDILGHNSHSVDLFECYSEAWDIRGTALCGDDFTMNPDGYAEYLSDRGRAALSEINDLKNTFVPPLLRFFALLDKASNAREMCRAVYDFIKESNLSDTVARNAEAEFAAGRRAEASESLQLYNALIDALDGIARVMGDEELSVREFYDSLKIMLDNASVGSIPTAEDQITVGSASMLRTGNVKCAIVLGLCEGEFPQSVKDSGLFSDKDKEILERHSISLSSNSTVRAADELFYVYRAMSAPTDKLFLFYRTSSFSGERVFPSMAIERIRRLFPRVREVEFSRLSPEERLLSPASALEGIHTAKPSSYTSALRAYLVAHPDHKRTISLAEIPPVNLACDLSPETAAGLFGRSLGLTQTLIDSYTDCPFEYMCKRLLLINDRQKAEFDYSNFGTYIHFIFESYLRRAVNDGVIGSPPDRSYIERTIDLAAEEYLERLSIGNAAASAHLRHRFARMRRLALLVATNMTREFADSSFRPEFFELSIGRGRGEALPLAPLVLPRGDGGTVFLTGKIDRVDTLRRGDDVYIRVLDYKSGAKTFSMSDLEKGKNIQLPLYLFALCNEEQRAFRQALGCPEGGRVIPAGAMYLSSLVKPVEMAGAVTGEDVLLSAEATIDRSGFLLGDEEILHEMSHSFSKQLLCGITKNKSGALSGRAALSGDEMSQINSEMKETVLRIADGITRGNMSPSPSVSSGEYRCSRCSMRSICRATSKFTDK